MIPYGRQLISEEDLSEVVRVLRSDFLTQGPEIPAFERELAAYCGASHGVAVNSATSALHIACMALGVGPGDMVWTSPLTFVASSNCALYCGAAIDFVDIDSRTYNISVDRLAEKLEESAKSGRIPKVVIPVHFSGQPCDLRAIHDLSVRYGFKVIEDASHAIGGCYQGDPIGNCKYSDITVFSFHPVKIITTTEGGMAVTNDDNLAKRMRLARSHGITRDQADMTEPSHGVWYYQQISLGFNYRLTDVQAALGRSQLRRVDQFVKRRAELAARYDLAFAGSAVITPWQHPDSGSAWHLYVVRFDLN
ncbi:MAG: UDP-4-amino-4,6-dideoxy-N-acetyl-beta-L-altrosamine transaminase, partial [Burkholderiales bacterium PBB4]